MSTWEIDTQEKNEYFSQEAYCSTFHWQPQLSWRALTVTGEIWLALFCPQVHPECDPGAGHHSGQKPRTASSLHHAGYRCDAKAGEPHTFQEVISQDLNLKVPWFICHNLAGAWNWQALFQAQEVWARNTDSQGRSPDISLRLLQETQTTWEKGCLRGNSLEAREVASEWKGVDLRLCFPVIMYGCESWTIKKAEV